MPTTSTGPTVTDRSTVADGSTDAERPADNPTPAATPTDRPAGAARPTDAAGTPRADPTEVDATDDGDASAPTGRPRPAPAAERDRVAAVAEQAGPDDEPVPTDAAAAARADFTPPGRLDRLGAPPSPPFMPAEAPYHWAAALPSAVGRKVNVRIAEDVIDIGGTPVPIDDIAEAVFRVQVEAAILRRAASARLSVTVSLVDGSKVRMAARNAASSRGAGEIADVAAYLWSLLGHATGADSADALIDKIQRGGEARIARVNLSRIGVSWKSEPIARWATIGPVERDDLEIVVPHDEGELRVPLTDTDAYLLPVLVPILRRRFS